jgi:hypothetical protein
VNDKWFILWGGEGNIWGKRLNTHAVIKNLATAGFATHANSL